MPLSQQRNAHFRRSEMSTTGGSVPRNKLCVPRWIVVLWTVSMGPLGLGFLPLTLSARGDRAGWVDGHPAAFNLLGLIPVMVGAACIIWCVWLHLTETGESFSLDGTGYLLTRGPYRYSRHP